MAITRHHVTTLLLGAMAAFPSLSAGQDGAPHERTWQSAQTVSIRMEITATPPHADAMPSTDGQVRGQGAFEYGSPVSASVPTPPE